MSGLFPVPTLLLGLLLAQGSFALVDRLPHDLLDNVDAEGDDGSSASDAYKADLPSSADGGATLAHESDLHADAEQEPAVARLANLVDKYDEHVFGASAARPLAMQRFAIMSGEAVKAERSKGQRRLRQVVQVAQAETRRAAQLDSALKAEHAKEESLSNQLQSVEAEKGKLKRTLSEAGEKIKNMSADIVSVYKEASAKIRSLRTTMASEASNLRHKHEKEEKELEDEARQLSGKLEATRSEATAAEAHAKAAEESLARKDAALRGQRLQSTQLKEAWDGLKRETSALTARLEALNRTRSEQTSELRALRSKLHTKEVELEKANREKTAASSQASKEEDNATHLQQALNDLAGELQKLHAQESRAATVHREEVSKLAVELNGLRAKLDEQAAKASTADSKAVEELKLRLKSLSASLEGSQSELKAMRSGEQSLKAGVAAKGQAEARAELANKELARLREDLERVQQAAKASTADSKAVEELKLRLKSLSASLEGSQSELKAMRSREQSLKAGVAAKGQAEARAETAKKELTRLREDLERVQQALKSSHHSLKSQEAAQGEADSRAENASKELARLRDTIEGERKARAVAELKMASQFTKKLAAEEKKATDLQKQLDAQRSSQHGASQPGQAVDATPQLLGDTAKLLEATSAEAQQLVQDIARTLEQKASAEQKLQATEAELVKTQHMVQVRDAALQRLGSALNESIEAGEGSGEHPHEAMPSKATMLESLHSDMQELKRLAPAEFDDMSRLFKVQQAHRQTLRNLAECRVSNEIEKALAGVTQDHDLADKHSQELKQELYHAVRELQNLQRKVDGVAHHVRRGNAALMKKVEKSPSSHVASEFLQAGYGSLDALADETLQHVNAVEEAVDHYKSRAASVDSLFRASGVQSPRHMQSYYSEVMLQMSALDGVFEKSSSAARLLDYMRAAVGA